jgi:hypothetical protein
MRQAPGRRASSPSEASVDAWSQLHAHDLHAAQVAAAGPIKYRAALEEERRAAPAKMVESGPQYRSHAGIRYRHRRSIKDSNRRSVGSLLAASVVSPLMSR